jgi:fumarate reductase subunit D
MAKREYRMAMSAVVGAVVAGLLSVATLLLPPELGGYNAWNDSHLALHNVAAVLTRIVVFALVGAALAGSWHRRRHTRRSRAR